MSERAHRPFWIHQLIEYMIGIALIVMGFQDPEPLVPAFCGVVVMVNASMVRGPFGAFRAFTRSQHRWVDVGVIGVLVAAAVQPWLEVSAIGRITLAGICVPYGFLWFYTDWASRPQRSQRRAARAGRQGDRFGRTAGRLAGKGWTEIKRRTEN